jgi:nicotinic acid mononucleotide adenylyltransferase
MIRSVGELLGRKVALFGLSANPPTGHSGHLGIVRFLVQTELFDEVWVLPVFQHMFAAKKSMEPFHHRVAMCKLCMSDASSPACNVRVMEIEKYAAEYYEKKEGLEYRVGTVDILDYIHEQCPGLDLHLVLGTDTYKDLIAQKWKQSDRYATL